METGTQARSTFFSGTAHYFDEFVQNLSWLKAGLLQFKKIDLLERTKAPVSRIQEVLPLIFVVFSG